MRDDTIQDDSLRHLLPANWWESAAGLQIATLKKGRNYGVEFDIEPEAAARQLQALKASGIDVIEIFAPADGLYAYNGLDTIDHYRIDPELGGMDDFRQFVRVAHSVGLAVVVFINVGYFSVEAPDWLEACQLKRDGQTGGKADWFLWAESADAPLPRAEEDNFVRPEHRAKAKYWGWQRSDLAGCYFWARWKADGPNGKEIPLPQTNWASPGWRAEAERIIGFWMDTGIDGMLVDAPLCYPWQTWEHNRTHITSVARSYGNVYLQPEGGRNEPWMTEAGYNSVQDYAIDYSAFETGDPSGIETSLRNYHDRMIAVGASLYRSVRTIEDTGKKHLERALLIGIGDLLAFRKGTGGPDEEETRLLQLKALHPALQQRAHRRMLRTGADDRHYAFLKTAADGSERVLVVMNWRPEPAVVSVDLGGVDTSGLMDLQTYTCYRREDVFERFELPLDGYGYRFLQVFPAP